MQKVEICEDMSCVMFNATGQSIVEILLEESGYSERDFIGMCNGKKRCPTTCILEEQEDRNTGELFYMLYIGKSYENNCR